MIMPAYTYTASASVVAHVGATIKMVDIVAKGDEETQDFEMDYEKLAEAITERTKVIVPVDLAGICANVDKIMEMWNSSASSSKDAVPFRRTYRSISLTRSSLIKAAFLPVFSWIANIITMF